MSKLKIISNASVLLGDAPVQDITEQPEREEILNGIFEDLLNKYIFKFSLKRKQLSRLSEKPAFGYLYQHQLPVDFLRLTKFKDNLYFEYEINGNKILSNQKDISIEYVSKQVDYDILPPSLRKYLEFRLAAETSYLITEDPQLGNNFYNLADRQLKRAVAVDAVNERSKPVWISSFDRARYSGVNRYKGGI